MSDQNEGNAVVVADSATVVSPVKADASQSAAGLSAGDLAAVVDTYRKANPDAVPELITGSTVAEIEASVPVAKTAYQGIADRFRAGSTSTAPHVPAGGSPAVVVDPSTLSTGEKIRRGLAARNK